MVMPPTTTGQTTIEKSPTYYNVRGVPSRIKNMSPQTKLILVIRNPVDRLLSDYAHMVAKEQKTKSLDELLFPDSVLSLVDTSLSIVRLGMYVNNLERWFQHFPRTQIHIVSDTELKRNTTEELNKIEKFLGLKSFITDHNFYTNTLGDFPCIINKVNLKKKCFGSRLGEINHHVSENTLATLQNFYRPFNRKLYQIIRQDFGWE